MKKIGLNDFIVSKCNKEAFEFCRAFADADSRGSLVSLYGPERCGKTLLVTALENRLKERFPDKAITNFEYMKFFDKISAEFLDVCYCLLSSADVLIIDRFQLARCDDVVQGVFAEIASSVLKRGGNVIVVHSCPVSNLKTFFDNVQYASCCQMLEIKYPDMNLMRKYLTVKQKEFDVKLSAEEEANIVRSRWSGVLSHFKKLENKRMIQELIVLFDELFGDIANPWL